MTFSSDISQTEVPAMPELYEFTLSNVSWHYTSYNQSVEFGGNTYEPAPISRKEFTREKELKVTRVNISAPLNDVAVLYLASVPVDLVSVNIYRAFLSDTDTLFQKIFGGVIKSVSIQDSVAQALCENINTLERNKLPRVCYQSFCNHDLFDDGCGLNEEDFLEEATVAVSGSTLISSTFDLQDDGYYNGGKVRFGFEAPRLITNHVGDTITLQIPFSAALQSGGTVEVLPGCSKAPATCRDKFDNIENFLGFPYIPSSNPVLFPFGVVASDE